MPLLFVKVVKALKAFEELSIPKNLFYQHRWEYDNILTDLFAAELAKKPLNIDRLIESACLGSQPTAHKRIKELIGMDLVHVHLGEDRREKYLHVSAKGALYLQRCSELIRGALI